MLLEVENQVCDIDRRIKEIDSDYFLMFNTESQKYEVHSSSLEDNTLFLNLPFDELDGRTIDYINMKLQMSVKKQIEEMKKKNEKINHDNNEKFLDKVGEMAKDIHRYARRHEDKDGGIDKNAYKTKFT